MTERKATIILWQKAGIICLFLVMLFPFKCLSQVGQSSNELDGELSKIAKLLESQLYRQSIEQAKNLVKSNPQSADVYLLIGLGYINIGTHPDSAVLYLEQGITKINPGDSEGETAVNLYLSLGKAYQMALKPADAIKIYERLQLRSSQFNNELIDEIKSEIETCQNALLFITNPIALKIHNLGAGVNSSFDDHTPLVNILGDKLVFTSRRQAEGLAKLSDEQYAEKIYVSNFENGKWVRTKQMKTFYRKNDHESAVSLSANGKQMFLFKSDPDGKNLYVTNLEGSTWGTPQKLPEPINSYSHETHCSLSADGSTLFFTSDREGGYGGLDIYMSKKQPNGVWGEARNLGSSINTVFNEETPMVYLDGKTLYFASEGHNSMGMFDIFYAQMQPDSSWSAALNLGYPINTPSDDMFFVPTLERNKAYYSTAQSDGNIGGLDICLVEFDPYFEGKLAVIEGTINQSGTVKTVRILVSRVIDEQLVGDYRPDLITGEYVMFLETGQRYEIKEVKEKTSEKIIGEIEVGHQMAFDQTKQPLKMQDVNIEPPLSPSERLLAQQKLEEKISAKGLDSSAELMKKLDDAPIVLPPVDYTVQLLALRTKRLRNYRIFKGLDVKNITEHRCVDGYYRYTYGIFTGVDASLAVRAKIIESGRFTDAFVRPISQLQSLTAK